MRRIAVFFLTFFGIRAKFARSQLSVVTNYSVWEGCRCSIAKVRARWILRGYYQPQIHRDARPRWMFHAWLVVYGLVGIQMGWILRPFIGDPNSPVQFFL